MRSPIIAFSIVAAATVSPALVAGAMVPKLPSAAQVPGNGVHLPAAPVGAANLKRHRSETRKDHSHRSSKHKHYVRQNDGQTAGGNAYSGSSNNVNGGDVFNVADDPDGVITNNAGSSTCPK